MHTKQRERLAILTLLATTAAWGGTFVVVKDGISQMPFMSLMSTRFTIAFVLLALMRPRALILSRVSWLRGAGLGVIGFLGYLFQTIGLQYTTASVSGFITGMFVVLTPLFSWVLFRERIGPEVWVAVMIATIGLGLISLHGWAFGVGEAWTLAGAAMWALQIIFFARWSTSGNAYSTGMLMIGFVALLFSLFTAPQGFVLPPNAGVWWGILGAAVFATALAFPAQAWGQSHIDATRAAVIFTMEPVFATLGGTIFGGDVLTSRILLGAGCIFVAMFVAEFGGRRRPDVDAMPHPSV